MPELDRKQQQRRAQEAVLKEAQEIAAPFFTEAGKTSLAKLKELFFNVLSYDPQYDSHHTAFREGYKGLIIYIEEAMDIVRSGNAQAGTNDGDDGKPGVKRSSGSHEEKS